MKNKILFFVITMLSAQTVFSIECSRSIKRIFTGYTTSTSKIHVEHGDGHSASVVRLPYINNDEKIVDRILSVLLVAHTAGKTVIFRYSQGYDGSEASCSPTVSQIIEAVWIE